MVRSWRQFLVDRITGRQLAGKALENAVLARIQLAVCNGFGPETKPPGDARQHLHSQVSHRVGCALNVLASGGDDCFKASNGWILEPGPSVIPGGGTGLFVRTARSGDACRSGEVLSLYPGIVFSAVQGHIASRGNPAGCEYLLTRFDYKFISAAPWARQDVALGVQLHCFARGHLIQHPPAGRMPNCAFIDFDIPSDLPHAWRPWVPNVMADKIPTPGSSERIMDWDRGVAGAVIIALEDIPDGSELFMDYRMVAPLAPSWWTQPPRWY